MLNLYDISKFGLRHWYEELKNSKIVTLVTKIYIFRTFFSQFSLFFVNGNRVSPPVEAPKLWAPWVP